MLDLLQTGKYGLLAQQKLLGTTSNNISNVNTVGYIRQQTNVYTSVIDWGIGSTNTRRVYNEYVQREMFRDQGNVGYYDAYMFGMQSVDKMLSDDSLSISSSLNSYFDSLQNAVQNPTSVAPRKEVLSRLNIMMDRYNTLNKNMQQQMHDVNAQVNDTTIEINSLLKGIYDINKEIRSIAGGQEEMALQLLDKRDQFINELSNLVDIHVANEANGGISVYLGSGQLLVNEDNYAIFDNHRSALDPNRQDIEITFANTKNTSVLMSYDSFGGKLGGLLVSTDEIRQSMRDLGQLALAFGDAMNKQNKGGLTLDGLAGADLVKIPEKVDAVSSNPANQMSVSFIPGKGSNISSNDYKVEFAANGAMKVYRIDKKGNKVEIPRATANQPESGYQIETGPNGNLRLRLEGEGIVMDFNKAQGAIQSTEMLVQPTMHAAYDVKVNATKPEDFAFASAAVANTVNGNKGNAVATMNGVTDTGPGMGITIDATTNKPVFATGAPTKVEIAANGDYVVKDANGATLGTAPASCNGQNVFANTRWNNQQLPQGYPGYDFNITGTVEPNDKFEIQLNFDQGAPNGKPGPGDNSNGVLLGKLQQASLVRSTKEHKMTFTEGYSTLLSGIGTAYMEADTSLKASQAKCTQTQTLFASAAGVNLDEEAANLVRFQQTYSACSKIITASQTIFDALLSAV